jgi:hypothetical protein
MMLSRRKLITGLISFAAAPAIVRASSLMPVKVMKPEDLISIIINYKSSDFVHLDVLYGVQWARHEIKDFYIDNS